MTFEALVFIGNFQEYLSNMVSTITQATTGFGAVASALAVLREYRLAVLGSRPLRSLAFSWKPLDFVTEAACGDAHPFVLFIYRAMRIGCDNGGALSWLTV